MRRSWSVVCLALALSVSAVARADEGADRNKAAAELAAAVLPQGQYKEMIDQIVAATVQGIEAELRQKGKSMPDGVEGRFRAEMEKLLPYQEMLDMQAGLLAKYYTLDEINQLGAFYRSPVGQKSLKVMPAVMADSMGMVQSKMMRELPGAVERIFTAEEAPAEKATEKAAKPATMKKAR
jgi:hypothetical protein